MKYSILSAVRYLPSCALWGAVCFAAALAPNTARSASDLGFGTQADIIPLNVVMQGSYTPPRNATVGTILQHKEAVAAETTIGTRPRTCPIYKTMRVSGTPVTGLANTYSTNVAGIGVRFYTTRGWGGGWELGPVDTSYNVPPSSRSVWRATAELVITGPVAGGVLTSLPSMVVTMKDCYGSDLRLPVTISAGARIVAGTCLVSTPSIAVNLPPANTRDFPSVGTRRGATNLRIGLNCNAGADVYVTLTDSTNPGNRTAQLTPAAGSSAKGLAMRLLYNGTPIAYGPDSAVAGNINQWRVGATSTVTEVPMTAEYISTGQVTPGELRAIATFTMSYQ